MTLRQHLTAWWLHSVCRHYCFACDRPTVHLHRHSAPTLEQVLRDEWRCLP